MKKATVLKSHDIYINDGQAYVTYNSERKELVVAFRGTVNFKNWFFTNGNFFKESFKCPKCKVHDGFETLYDSMKSKMLSTVALIEEKYKPERILVTGHSLGGAMSTLAAYDLHEVYGDRVDLVNFGSPRIGNK